MCFYYLYYFSSYEYHLTYALRYTLPSNQCTSHAYYLHLMLLMCMFIIVVSSSKIRNIIVHVSD